MTQQLLQEGTPQDCQGPTSFPCWQPGLGGSVQQIHICDEEAGNEEYGMYNLW